MALRPSAAAGYRSAHMEEEGNSCFDSFDGLRMSVSSDTRQDAEFARALRHPSLMPAAAALAFVGGVTLWLCIAAGGRILAFAWITSIFSLLFAASLVSRIFEEDVSGCGSMLAIASAIRQGANGFLFTQYAAILRFAFAVAFVLFSVYFMRPPSSIADTAPMLRAFITALSFLIGCGCSAFAGWIGVWISVRCNIRVAAAAARQSSGDALKIAFNGGAVASLISAALCIVGICLMYSGCYLLFVSCWGYSQTVLPMLLTGYSFGASFVALFMQLGGGIYTKAADVGADLIGKIEAGIPEDDPRNPAVIADLVGDNVGDCAGSMADVFESIAAEVIGTMILGAELSHGMPSSAENSHSFILFPLIVHSMDMIVSSVGIWLVSRASESQCSQPLAVMRHAYSVSAILSIAGLFFTTRYILYVPTLPHAWFWFFCCGIVGVATAFLLVLITQYYTDYAYAPVQSIAAASISGHATNIIAGVSVGFVSTAAPSIVICAAVLSSYHCGASSGVTPAATAGEFGVAIACMGMLGTAVFVLSMNNFGPIADNAGGIVEMGGCAASTRAITDRLDAVGNVTKAATKGYAVGGSALACFILFRAYLGEMARISGTTFESVNIAHVECLVGGILGIMLVFLFTGLTVASVGRAAQEVVKEVRRQFAEHPGILLPNSQETPNYSECVTIVTRAAHREMLLPAALALGLPVAVGIVFRAIGAATARPMLAAEVLGSFMVFSSFTGLMMAMFLDNSGGAWDNAKKYIESGQHGGKGSTAHKAAVTGDTVGDPFKDTAGPSLHVIITTMATTIIVLGPLFIGSPLKDSVI